LETYPFFDHFNQKDKLTKDQSTFTLSEAPTASFLPFADQAIAATFFMLSSKGMIFPEYLSFIQSKFKINEIKIDLKHFKKN
jgi:hypothetical protein